MTKPFSIAFKQKMVERLTGKDAISAYQLSKETGVTQQSLSRWLREAHSLPISMEKHNPGKWTVEQKIRILAESADLKGDELSVLLARESVSLATLEQWKLALEEEGRAAKATTRRIRKLERELARKEKALAEAAALLVLKKKVDHLYEEEEDDDTTVRSDK